METKKEPKRPLPIPWDRIVAYNVALVCDITNPPGMKAYIAQIMAIGDKAAIMFPLSLS